MSDITNSALPELYGWRYRLGHGDYRGVQAWCNFCNCWHYHAAMPNEPVITRVAHCCPQGEHHSYIVRIIERATSAMKRDARRRHQRGPKWCFDNPFN